MTPLEAITRELERRRDAIAELETQLTSERHLVAALERIATDCAECVEEPRPRGADEVYTLRRSEVAAHDPDAAPGFVDPNAALTAAREQVGRATRDGDLGAARRALGDWAKGNPVE